VLTWAPHHPALIDAVLELLDADGAVLDRVESYFGLRRVELRDGRLVLNSEPTFMKLVLAQNYWPDTLLAASDEQLRREVELGQGARLQRRAHPPEDREPAVPVLVRRAGAAGLGRSAGGVRVHQSGVRALTREWLDAVRRDYSHPCIVAWVPLNESWGVPNLERDPAQRAFVRALYHLTKALDPTRPVLGNDGWQHVAGDIFGVHDYAMDGDTLRARYGSREAIERTFEEIEPLHHPLLTDGHALREEAVVVSEFGGLSIRPSEGRPGSATRPGRTRARCWRCTPIWSGRCWRARRWRASATLTD
jgi:hypothetical protein